MIAIGIAVALCCLPLWCFGAFAAIALIVIGILVLCSCR